MIPESFPNAPGSSSYAREYRSGIPLILLILKLDFQSLLFLERFPEEISNDCMAKVGLMV